MKNLLLSLGVFLSALAAREGQAQPANDNFASRVTLTGVIASTSGANAGATIESGEANQTGGGGGGTRWGSSVWFTWNAPASGVVAINTAGSDFDTVLRVVTGSAVNSLTQVALNNNAGGGVNTSFVQFNAVVGTQYHIMLGGFRNFGSQTGATGNYQLTLAMPPTVAISAPVSGAVFPTGSSFTLSATASTPSPPITRMDFYRGGVLVGTDFTAPYSITVSNTPPGTNALVAAVTDSANLQAFSATVNVAMLAVGMTIVSPADGAVVANNSALAVSAVGVLASGSITNVQFLVDGTEFGQDATIPFAASWALPTPGPHTLSAIGQDTSGLSYTSAPVLIAVLRTLVPTGSVWKFLDNGSDQGTAWTTPSFSDESWASGLGELGYGDTEDNPARPEATVISYGADPNNKFVTTYFRHRVVITNVAGYTNFIARVVRDDGAVVHVNGVEAARQNMPAGAVTYTTVTGNTTDEATYFASTLSAGFFVEGTNVIAVEIHQTGEAGLPVTSSDVSFDLQLDGVPIIPRNLPPAVALTSPTNSAYFLGPPDLTLTASATDPDIGGSVAKVEFFANGVKLGEDVSEPYEFVWSNPPLGPHALRATATDDQNASASSATAGIVVYDILGTPFVRFTIPTNGQVFDGPTNLTITAEAYGIGGVNQVNFYTNNGSFASDSAAPYSAVWVNAAYGTNTLTAEVFDAIDNIGEAAPVTFIVNPPPPNLFAPTVASVTPAPGATLSNLTSIQITFSERVLGVNAADLRINGVAATGVTGSGSNYTFAVAQPPYGSVAITWLAGHGIEDTGFPPLPFDGTAGGEIWNYNLPDLIAPTIAARVPANGATVTNLSQATVTFSEAVLGVDAADLLVNGQPAIGLSGSGSNYTFGFSQPAGGTVIFSWAGGNGIADLASPPNSFDAAGAGASWSVTLDSRTILVQSNSTWLFIKGTAEASNPIEAWRAAGFNDSGWSNALAPFFYGDAYNSGANPGTLLSDMQGGYASIYLRKKFFLPNASAATNLFFAGFADDGYIVWINGAEIVRVNAPGGTSPAYNAEAPSAVNEPNNNGVPYTLYPLPNASAWLVDGTNVITVHAFNNQPATSSDFGFNAQLYTFLADPGTVPPRVASVSPAAGEVFFLTNITVTFTEAVSEVDSEDLLVNGLPATSVTGGSSNNVYSFRFAQPAFGPVSITWAEGHGILDFDNVPKPFDASAASSVFQYSLLNPSAPTVAAQSPPAGSSIINTLTQLTVSFSEAVTGVDAADLRLNGAPAANVTGGPANYAFTFAQPAYGAVSVSFITAHGITDLELPANPFDATRAGNSWSYTLVDQVAPVVASKNPAAGSLVTNLTQLAVTFSEPVAAVNAGDLLINGTPAGGVTGSGAGPYVFTFAQPNATVINVTWTPAHGIHDLAPVPNAFNSSAPGAIWSYTTPDTLPPSLAAIDPAPNITVRSLTQVRVTFIEPVVGVDTNDLLLNGVRARQITGSGAGPYTFTFLPPSPGSVEARWSATNGITDLAVPVANPFTGSEWTYTYDPNATFAGKVIVSEIMFNPPGGAAADEWIELRNLTTNLVNLTGWRFTKGVNFTFPNVSIPASGHLVAAANLAAFQAKYPAVSNAIGGWTGSLANNDEPIELQTALGETVNSVAYATEGDWARRERGNGAFLITGITRNGNTATITSFAHGLSGNDQVVITGADQPEYNGRFTVSGTTPATFNITVGGTPVSPATGIIIGRWVLDDNFGGWSWFNGAAGFGRSLELLNPAVTGGAGQNWLASSATGGTPGQANSSATNDLAPLIHDVTHFPAVPKSTDTISITARLRDEASNGVASAMLFWRDHTAAGPGGFSTVPMLDRGTNNDGAAGDGLYGAVLPQQFNNGTVIEFYVAAADTGGRTRTWPAAVGDTNDAGGLFGTPVQIANALLQVDNEITTAAMPAVRIVMSGSDRAIFPPSSRNSDAATHCTLITTDGDGTKIRYLCDTRIRGAGSRTRNPPNNRLAIPNDNRWNGQSGINLNSQFAHAQLVGNVIAQKSGLPATDVHLVQYRINGANPAPITAPVNNSGNGAGWGVYLMLKPVNGDLAAELYPEDGGGNVYRASTGNHNADLTYQGATPASYITRGYFKNSNRTENDWTDLMNLTFAFSQVAADTDYRQAIQTNVNVKEFMTYFAVGSLVNFSETALFNGRGDDFALYRGEADKRFVVLGHDFDTVFGQGDTTNIYPSFPNSSIFLMLNPPNGNALPLGNTLNRFMRDPAFAPFFYAELQRLADTTFNPTNLNPLLDQLLANWGGPGPDATVIANMKSFAAARRASVLAQIPLALTVNSSLATQNGYLATATAGVTLFGASHAINTRRVLVNGTLSAWSALDARWTNTVTLQPGVNRVLVQSLDSNDVEFARATVDIWYDDGSVQAVSGAIASDTTWTAANGPYNVTGSITVNNGATLTIQPGTTLYLGAGVNLAIANGGRLLAEGTATAPIRFTRTPGTATSWGGVTIAGGAGSPETRIAHAHFEFNGSSAIDVNGGDLFLSHCSFGNTAVRYLDLDGASFVIEDCFFPTATAAMEPVHGTAGIKAGGRGIVRRNFWGKTQGYNDSFDFTGGNRPGPVLQIINNVFMGSDDDLVDFDSTDAWIEGNIFLHVHRNGSPDSASAISGGADNADTSQITAIGNLFYDVDQAANAKQGNFYTFLNNTIANQNRVGSQDIESGVITMADYETVLGLGFYLEGNIISGAERLVRTQGVAQVTYTNNIVHQVGGPAWTGPGGNNSTNDPLFVRVPQLAETMNFNSWADAQVMWQWFSLRPGSPARDTGPGGLDKGGVIPSGARISGEPAGTTPFNTATLRVGPNRASNGIPVAGFPNGSGFTHYRWRLDGGPWSAERPIATAISLNNLSTGPHFVEAVGRNDAGFYQDNLIFGADASVSVSRTWTVNPATLPLRLNEILASNTGTSNHFGTTPDLIEIVNRGGSPLDLSGVGLSDDPLNPAKFIFPLNTSLAAGAHLTVFANSADGTPGHHVGFTLAPSGGSIYLHAAAADGGSMVDAVTFGLQLPDRSIGRLADGSWALCTPTFGGLNRAAATGEARSLRINEWLALGTAPFDTDFVELYNPDPLPVPLGGLYMTDEIIGWPGRHQIPALSFIAGSGYLRLLADGGAGADHLNFSLGSDQGNIALYQPDLTMIDLVTFQPQRLNVSQGRSANGSQTFAFFTTPTPGAPNPLITGPAPNGGLLVINEILAANVSLLVEGRSSDWIELYNGTATNVNLADLSLTDDTLSPRRHIFASGTLAPGQFARIVCDPGSTNTGPLVSTNLALSASGGTVYLFDALASGGSLLSSITYGLQAADLSIGRVPDGGTNWSLTSPTPGTANVAIPTLGDPATLRINEWMADAGANSDDWFELYNPGTQPVALGGLHFTDDLNNRTKHTIPALSFIGSGTNGYIQIRADGNTGAGADHVGFSLNATTGEDVGISTAAGALIDGVSFGPQVAGVSQGRFSDGATNLVTFPGTDSPAAPNYRFLTTVAISEVLTHTDEPLEDAIELRNLTGADLDLSGWWLSDDQGALQKYQIPFPTILPANGFTVIYETAFTNVNTAAIPFALSSHGDEVVLSAAENNALTGFRAFVDFGPADNSVSFGRHLTSDGRAELVAMGARTFGADDPGTVEEFRTGTGAANAIPRVGPVVISEIMYHPPDDGTNDNSIDEFVELRNITTSPVPLHDPAHPTNAWRLRDAVDFDFHASLTLPAGGTVIVVGFDPVNNPTALAAFRARYQVDLLTPIVGPWTGKLGNDDEDIELRKPGVPDTNGVDYILVERVHYFDLGPWPALADGTGLSLQRAANAAFGDDPANWTAAPPSLGVPSSTADFDGDGLPDTWEYANGFDPLNPADAALDTDGDGLSNLQEYQLGSDPRNARSGLRLYISPGANPTNVVLSFTAVASSSFRIEFTDALGTPWQLLQSFAATTTNHDVAITVPAANPGRFYRLSAVTGFSLHINSIAPLPGNLVRITFNAPADQDCLIDFKASFAAPSWTAVTNFPAAPTNRVLQADLPANGASGFYRVRSP